MLSIPCEIGYVQVLDIPILSELFSNVNVPLVIRMVAVLQRHDAIVAVSFSY